MKQVLRITCWSSLAVMVVLPSLARGQVQSPKAEELIKQFDQDRDGKLNNAELDQALLSLFPQTREYVRVTKNKSGTPVALETSVSSLASPDGEVQVDLIGAVHVADLAYYRELNERFRDYDVVLYELVAPEGTRVPQGGQKSQHPVGRMQQGIKGLLDLSFQLDHIDYTSDKLVHADMSPEEFAKSMKDRGESFIQILFRMMGQAAAQSGDEDRPSDIDLLRALIFFESRFEFETRDGDAISRHRGTDARVGRSEWFHTGWGTQQEGVGCVAKGVGKGEQEDWHLLRCRTHAGYVSSPAGGLWIATDDRGMGQGLGYVRRSG